MILKKRRRKEQEKKVFLQARLNDARLHAKPLRVEMNYSTGNNGQETRDESLSASRGRRKTKNQKNKSKVKQFQVSKFPKFIHFKLHIEKKYTQLKL